MKKCIASAERDPAEEIRVDVPSADWHGDSYVEIDGLVTIMRAWLEGDVRRAYRQEGHEDAVLVLSWWDAEAGRQTTEVIWHDNDAARATGMGWSLAALPFAVDTTFAAPPAPLVALTNGPLRVADLDGSVDAADWIEAGHVLDASEVEYIRGLVLPESVRALAAG